MISSTVIRPFRKVNRLIFNSSPNLFGINNIEIKKSSFNAETHETKAAFEEIEANNEQIEITANSLMNNSANLLQMDPFTSNAGSVQCYSTSNNLSSFDNKINPNDKRNEMMKKLKHYIQRASENIEFKEQEEEVIEENSDVKMTKKMEQKLKNEYLANQEYFNKKIQAYIKLHAELKHYSKVLSIVKYYNIKRLKDHHKFKIETYNIAIEAFASISDYDSILQLIRCMEKDQVSPDINTFFNMLYCLGRSQDPDVIHHVEYTINLMKEYSLPIEDLYKFELPNKIIYINKALQIYNPSYKPPPCKSKDLNYIYPIVSKLNKSILNCNDTPIILKLFNEEEFNRLILKQIEVEEKGEIKVPRIDKDIKGPQFRYYSNQVQELEYGWRNTLLKQLHCYINVNKNTNKFSLLPFLQLLEPEKYVDILIRSIRTLSSGSPHYSSSRSQIAYEIANQIFKQYAYNYQKENGIVDRIKTIYEEYCSWFRDKEGNHEIPRIYYQKLIDLYDKDGLTFEQCPKRWPRIIMKDIGLMLFNIMLKNLHVKKSDLTPIPVMYELYDYQIADDPFQIKINPMVIDIYKNAQDHYISFNIDEVPMLTPPVPWININSGGYVFGGAPLVRMPAYPEFQTRRLVEVGNQSIYPVFDALNVLGCVPWKINTKLLDIIIDLFKQGKMPELDIPLHPANAVPVNKNQIQERKTYEFQLARYAKEKNEMNSLWFDALYKLSLANFFRNDIFWFPFNMDFRGRCYPCPPHLTHFSADIYRSLFLFGEGKKIGHEGLWWLKLHIINTSGLKKHSSFEDRVLLCDELIDNILDSAKNPLNGKKWWTTADDPWQTLAACMELAEALALENPEEYISHLPIHQDGSCNGLQHYAALGRDSLGAKSVNLSPSVMKMDVYSDICELVEKRRKLDAANLKSPFFEIANVLDGFVKRKVIKQTVMTTVYGVTKYGAKLQVLKQLKAIDEFPATQYFKASAYLVELIFSSLGEIFSSAENIQNWLTDSAKLITKLRGDKIEWVTPLGFPVVQAYFKKLDENPFSKFSSRDEMLFHLPPNSKKQQNGFPPNFIHSLDSTHLMLTALFSQEKKITFAAIHDCFWTHASTVPTMNKICREQFVSLHSEPILEDLAEFLMNKHGFSDEDVMLDLEKKAGDKFKLNKLLCAPFKKGSFDIKEVLKSQHFFS